MTALEGYCWLKPRSPVLKGCEWQDVEGLWMAGCFEPAGCPLTRCLHLPLVFGVVFLRGILILWVELHGYVCIFRIWVGFLLISWFTVSWLLILERGKHFSLLLCVLNDSYHVSILNQSVVYNNSALICLWSMHQTITLLLVAFLWLL